VASVKPAAPLKGNRIKTKTKFRPITAEIVLFLFLLQRIAHVKTIRLKQLYVGVASVVIRLGKQRPTAGSPDSAGSAG
jgi:hypothetical protein